MARFTLGKLTCAAFALALSACAAGAQPAGDDTANGLRIAEANCAVCHAIGASGDSTHADAPPFRTFAQNYPVRHLEEAFAEGILVGHPDMPEFVLEPDQIEALLSYIESVQAP